MARAGHVSRRDQYTEVVFQKGFGKTAIENGTEVDEHTLFAIASTTKAMVVAGLLMLADEERLST